MNPDLEGNEPQQRVRPGSAPRRSVPPGQPAQRAATIPKQARECSPPHRLRPHRPASGAASGRPIRTGAARANPLECGPTGASRSCATPRMRTTESTEPSPRRERWSIRNSSAPTSEPAAAARPGRPSVAPQFPAGPNRLRVQQQQANRLPEQVDHETARLLEHPVLLSGKQAHISRVRGQTRPADDSVLHGIDVVKIPEWCAVDEFTCKDVQPTPLAVETRRIAGSLSPR